MIYNNMAESHTYTICPSMHYAAGPGIRAESDGVQRRAAILQTVTAGRETILLCSHAKQHTR